MRAASPTLIAFLASNNELGNIVDLYTFTLLSGDVVRLTSHDVDVPFGGHVFSAAGPFVDRSRIRQTNTLEVDEITIEIMADIAHTVMGMPFLQAVAQGWFRKADVLVQRLVMSVNEAVSWFSGNCSAAEVDHLVAKLSVVSELYRLDVNLPRNLVQAPCRHTLYGPGCDLNKTLFGVAKIAAAGSSTTTLVPSVAFAQTDGYFNEGFVVMTSGANSGMGIMRSIRAHLGGKLFLNVPLPFGVNVSDTFTVYPGCDKTMTTCTTKFSNLVKFGGQPFVPVPETAI